MGGNSCSYPALHCQLQGVARGEGLPSPRVLSAFLRLTAQLAWEQDRLASLYLCDFAAKNRFVFELISVADRFYLLGCLSSTYVLTDV